VAHDGHLCPVRERARTSVMLLAGDAHRTTRRNKGGRDVGSHRITRQGRREPTRSWAMARAEATGKALRRPV
jgi:hypothetical protein